MPVHSLPAPCASTLLLRPAPSFTTHTHNPQVFLVVTDSVLKQLDGLKNDGAVRPAIRRFLGQGLDAYGPAGAGQACAAAC